MSYSLSFTPIALDDISKLKMTGDRTLLKKIDNLLNELREHPYGERARLKNSNTSKNQLIREESIKNTD
jgi:mRNA-degrading endonuclease RelE of RelBE toxin-antitoxin system